MFSPHKNSFLQLHYGSINPRLINRTVDEAMGKLPDCHDMESPLLRLASNQPTIPVQHVDVTRAKVAFGRWALPKLRRELHDKDPLIQSQAINSIADLVHDPEKAFEAIRLRIVDRLQDLMVSGDISYRERVCLILTTLASQAEGRLAIINNPGIVENLANLAEDPELIVRHQAAALIEMIALQWTGADLLVEYGFIQLLLDYLLTENEDIAELHLKTLKHLMYAEGGMVAFQNGAIPVFLMLLSKENTTIVSLALECIALVTSTKCGKKRSITLEILETLNEFLHNSERKIHTAAAEALMFTTHRTKAKKQADKIKGLPKRLVELSKDFHCPELQLFAIKALCNITEHPNIRKLMLENYLTDVQKIIIITDDGKHMDEMIMKHQAILIDIIKWKP